MADRLLIVGNPAPTHIGSNFYHAAEELGLDVRMLDVNEAFHTNFWIQKFNWYFRDRRPPCLEKFSRKVNRSCLEFSPRWLLSVGLSPLISSALQDIGRQGVLRLNYSTDDPWNPAHRTEWFLSTLSHYDAIFSVRRSNLTELKKAGCPQISYSPFAYAPELHYPEPPDTLEEKTKFDCDVIFIGGADHDRLPYIKALIKAGVKVHLYGGYWERYSETKMSDRGYANPQTFRKAIGGARIALCLVRRANRDGNSMRTFEIPAIGGCMLTEDTEEHRDLLGKEGENVLYFRTPDEMIDKARFLIRGPEESKRLAKNSHALITIGRHTYKDRLTNMIGYPVS